MVSARAPFCTNPTISIMVSFRLGVLHDDGRSFWRAGGPEFAGDPTVLDVRGCGLVRIWGGRYVNAS